jgi:hypothetical protein
VGEDRGEAEGGGAEEHGGQEGSGGLGQGRCPRASYAAHGRRSRYPVNLILFNRKTGKSQKLRKSSCTKWPALNWASSKSSYKIY